MIQSGTLVFQLLNMIKCTDELIQLIVCLLFYLCWHVNVLNRIPVSLFLLEFLCWYPTLRLQGGTHVVGTFNCKCINFELKVGLSCYGVVYSEVRQFQMFRLISMIISQNISMLYMLLLDKLNGNASDCCYGLILKMSIIIKFWFQITSIRNASRQFVILLRDYHIHGQKAWYYYKHAILKSN